MIIHKLFFSLTLCLMLLSFIGCSVEKTEVTEVERMKAQLDSTQQRREAYLQGLRQVKEKEQLESALKEARAREAGYGGRYDESSL